MSNYAQYWLRLRLSLGLSQGEFGRYAGVGAQFVSNVERDGCRYSLTHVRRLIRRFDLNDQRVIDVILEREETRLCLALKIKKVCGTDRSK